MKTLNGSSVGISHDDQESLRKKRESLIKKLEEPGLSADERVMYEEALNYYGPEEQNKKAEYIASLKRIYATIEQTLDQPVVPGVPCTSQRFDSYQGGISGVLSDLTKHIQRMEEEGIEGLSIESIEWEERLRDAMILPGSFSPEEWTNLIVGKFKEDAMSVLDDKK